NATLRGAHVVILPDNDTPGRNHAQHVVQALTGVAARLKVVALPGLADKGDVSDWLATAGRTRAAFDAAVGAGPGMTEQDMMTAQAETSHDGDDQAQAAEPAHTPLALHMTKNGTPRPILANIILILTHDPRWQHVLGYDEFNACATLRQQPPYLAKD